MYFSHCISSSLSLSSYSTDNNYQEKYNVDQAKALVRPGVYEEIRKQVDELLIMNLKKIQMQIAPKNKKNSKKKKKKSKKNKKDKKKRGLPGDKIAELKGLDSDQMLSMLIEHQLVVRVRNKKLDHFIGEYNYSKNDNKNDHHNVDRIQGTYNTYVLTTMLTSIFTCLNFVFTAHSFFAYLFFLIFLSFWNFLCFCQFITISLLLS